MITNADIKYSELTSILNQHFKEIVNLTHLKLIVHFVIALCGIHLYKIKPIKIKKHSRKAKSVFKIGLSFLSNVFLYSQNKDDIGIAQFLSCT